MRPLRTVSTAPREHYRSTWRSKPEYVIKESEIHSHSMKPALAANAQGIKLPEYPSNSLVVTVHAMVVQLETVRLSYPYSVLKAVNVRISVDAATGAMVADIHSEFA